MIKNFNIEMYRVSLLKKNNTYIPISFYKKKHFFLKMLLIKTNLQKKSSYNRLLYMYQLEILQCKIK